MPQFAYFYQDNFSCCIHGVSDKFLLEIKVLLPETLS